MPQFLDSKSVETTWMATIGFPGSDDNYFNGFWRLHDCLKQVCAIALAYNKAASTMYDEKAILNIPHISDSD